MAKVEDKWKTPRNITKNREQMLYHKDYKMNDMDVLIAKSKMCVCVLPSGPAGGSLSDTSGKKHLLEGHGDVNSHKTMELWVSWTWMELSCGVVGKEIQRQGRESRTRRRGVEDRGGACEASLSVLIFPAERETDRKSMVSFFCDMKELDRGLSFLFLPLPP